MQPWSMLGMVGAGLSLAVVGLCLYWSRRDEPPGWPHWVSFLGSTRAQRRVRRVFRGGLTIGAALYGAFAIALALRGGVRVEIAGALLALAAAMLALLALCPMDVVPTAHVVGALGYFVCAIAGAAAFAVPPHGADLAATTGALLGGIVVIAPLFAIAGVHTLGRPPRAIVAYFLDENVGNRWVRALQHQAVGLTGVLLFLIAWTLR